MTQSERRRRKITDAIFFSFGKSISLISQLFFGLSHSVSVPANLPLALCLFYPVCPLSLLLAFFRLFSFGHERADGLSFEFKRWEDMRQYPNYKVRTSKMKIAKRIKKSRVILERVGAVKLCPKVGAVLLLSPA